MSKTENLSAFQTGEFHNQTEELPPLEVLIHQLRNLTHEEIELNAQALVRSATGLRGSDSPEHERLL